MHKLYIGIELEGSSVSSALVDAEGKIIAERRDQPSEDLVAQLIEIIKAFRAQAENQVVAVGIGLPGLINLKTGRIELSPNFQHLTMVSLQDEVLRATRLPVVVDNDANMAAYGEWLYGIAKGFNSLIYITIGTGIGAGIILGGQMWRGSSGFAGEFGHTTVDVDGNECTCGNTGCLETVASGPNIVRRVQQRLYRDRTSSLSRLLIPRDQKMSPEDVIRAALSGDELTRVVLERTGSYIGIALGNLINLLNPELVVFGGKMMAVGEILLRPIIEETRLRSFAPSFAECRIVLSSLKDRAGVLGAAMLARDSLLA
ncbi:MAG: ROK family protein [Acidobacteriota bacterium]|nr:ROK family protein [Blastocatellia bacterium]MDW8411779.1 ROK family protein [Acidobacteriota bacterium]